MLMRTMELLEIDLNVNSNFNYVDDDQIAEWARQAISIVTSMKDSITGASVMGGTGNNIFSPNNYITKEQAFIAIMRLFRVN